MTILKVGEELMESVGEKTQLGREWLALAFLLSAMIIAILLFELMKINMWLPYSYSYETDFLEALRIVILIVMIFVVIIIACFLHYVDIQEKYLKEKNLT